MQTLTTILRKKLNGAEKIGILGVGSELRADDAAGLLVASKLQKNLKKNRKVKIFLGHTAPENLTGEIKNFKPSHLIIIDSVDINKRPGTIIAVEPDNTNNFSFSTHKLPIKLVADYLALVIACKTIIIGIQPHSLAFSQKVSNQVIQAVEKISQLLSKIISSDIFNADKQESNI